MLTSSGQPPLLALLNTPPSKVDVEREQVRESRGVSFNREKKSTEAAWDRPWGCGGWRVLSHSTSQVLIRCLLGNSLNLRGAGRFQLPFSGQPRYLRETEAKTHRPPPICFPPQAKGFPGCHNPHNPLRSQALLFREVWVAHVWSWLEK